MPSFQWPPQPSGGGGGITSINSQSGPAVTISAGSGISVSSLANNITITNTGSGSSEVVEYRTISSGEAAAKSLTLSSTPMTAANVLLDIISGCSQEYGADFTVSVDVLSWSGLALDGILAAGDILRIAYFS